jgi:hypothetical protein
MKARQVKRLARTVLSVSLMVVIGAGFSTISSASDEASLVKADKQSKYVEVVLTPGESLWSLAAMLADNAQIAAVVADIVEVNQLKSADVAAGTRLLVPTN